MFYDPKEEVPPNQRGSSKSGKQEFFDEITDIDTAKVVVIYSLAFLE
jgi:hypothetical protein